MPTLDELATAYAGPPIALPVGDNLRRPWCHNREPRPVGAWEPRQGHHDALHYILGMSDAKPRYRWRRAFSADRCAAWDCAPTETPTPVLTRWDCRGCRWMPERARIHFQGEQA